MKAQLIGRKFNKACPVRSRSRFATVSSNGGFSTLEVLIAFAVLILCIGAVILVIFGNQSVTVDSQINNEAISKAQALLEKARADSRDNFNAITETTPDSADFYKLSLDVFTISACAKKLTSQVGFGNVSRPLEIKLATIVTSLSEAALLGTYCDPTPPGDWDEPARYSGVSASDFHGQGTGVAAAYINDIRYAFLTTDSSSKENFYVIDTSIPDSISSSDIHSIKVANGLYGITIAKINDKYYAFVLTDYEDANQLQVIDISIPTTPVYITSASTTIPNITVGEDSTALSIFYYDEKIYVGTKYLAFGTTGTNHEFHIFDVSNPDSLPWPDWETSVNINRNVNDIAIKGDMAYLATGEGSAPYTPLKVVDLSSGNIVEEFSTPLGRPGNSLSILGDKLYFGTKRASSGNDFYIIDIDDPDTALSSRSLGQNNTEVGDILVQGQYAFIGLMSAGAQHSFQIWDITNSVATTSTRINSACTIAFPQNVTGIAYIDNLIFASFRSSIQFQIIFNNSALCS